MREADTKAPLVVHGHCPPAPKRHQSLFNHWLLNPPLEPGRVGALAEARANPLPEPPCAGTLPKPTRVGATADGLSPHHWILVFGAGHRRWPHRHPSPLPLSPVGRKEEAPDLPLCIPPCRPPEHHRQSRCRPWPSSGRICRPRLSHSRIHHPRKRGGRG
ncbi:Os10g0123500 [Oryza sativa Japonica Group]|uniref:Os10g0123500 protein n=1 Tax=Oryza sativa subsp. japonica TaxID=39947 RepID=A0A0P0XRX3_ORYSJ|nr:Os10g0123500 [Oryza sativa Japonica Group]